MILATHYDARTHISIEVRRTQSPIKSLTTVPNTRSVHIRGPKNWKKAMIVNVHVHCRVILVLCDGPRIGMSRKNGDAILTRCTLKSITADKLVYGRNALGFLVVVFHNPLLKDG